MDTQTIVTKRLDISMLEDSVGQHRRKTVVKEGWSIGRITRNREGGESVRSSQGLLFKGWKGMLIYENVILVVQTQNETSILVRTNTKTFVLGFLHT